MSCLSIIDSIPFDTWINTQIQPINENPIKKENMRYVVDIRNLDNTRNDNYGFYSTKEEANLFIYDSFLYWIENNIEPDIDETWDNYLNHYTLHNILRCYCIDTKKQEVEEINLENLYEFYISQ